MHGSALNPTPHFPTQLQKATKGVSECLESFTSSEAVEIRAKLSREAPLKLDDNIFRATLTRRILILVARAQGSGVRVQDTNMP